MLTKLDLNHFDFKTLASLTDLEFQNYCKQEKLSHHHEWLLPQLVAQFGQWQLVKRDGKILVRETLKHNIGTDPKPLVLWRFTRIARGDLTLKQHTNPEYATLTPLILLGFKKYQGVPYSHWQGCEDLNRVVEPKLFEALSLDQEVLSGLRDLRSSRLLEIRDQGLLNKTGAKAGTLKPANSTWSLTGITGTEIGGLPKLTQTILTQIWLAHPQNRSSSMILDLWDWDKIPTPLVSGEIFQKPTEPAPQSKKQPNAFELPWL